MLIFTVYHFVHQLIIYNSNVVLDSSDLYLSAINKHVCIYWFQMRDLKIAVHMIYPNTFPSPHVDQLAEKSLFCWNKNLINSYKSKLFDIVNLLFWGEEANGDFHNLQGTSFLNYKHLKEEFEDSKGVIRIHKVVIWMAIKTVVRTYQSVLKRSHSYDDSFVSWPMCCEWRVIEVWSAVGYPKRLCTHTTSRVQHWGLKTIDVYMLLQSSNVWTKDDWSIHATSGLTLGTKVDSSKHATSGFKIRD
jgi:hypothetical protein